MKKIVSLLLSIFIVVLCVPCNEAYAKDAYSALLSINFCDADGTNNKHIIYEDGDSVSAEWSNSKDGVIDGLRVVPECNEKGMYTYTIQISKDIDLYFNTFTASNLNAVSQDHLYLIKTTQAKIFSSCIFTYKSCIKIESVDGDHKLNIHFLNSSLENNAEIYCVYNIAPYYQESFAGYETGAYFGNEENKLTINFSCDNYDNSEEKENPIVNAFNFDGYVYEDDRNYYYYYVHFNNFDSTAVLTGCYIMYILAGSCTGAYFENNCNIDFTNIDPFNEYPNNISNFDRCFLRLNGPAYIIDSKISTHLNDTKLEADDNHNIMDQIENTGIASHKPVYFTNSDVHIEGFAAVATSSGVIIDNSKVEFIGRLVGIITSNPAPGCIQYINPGSDSYLRIESLEPDSIEYELPVLGLQNASTAIVPIQYIKLLIDSEDIFLECSKTVGGDDYKPLNEFEESEYSYIKKIRIGHPYDFEFRYSDQGVQKSSKYYKGNHFEDTDNLPQGFSLEEYNEKSEYPYVLTVDGDRTINVDVNNLVQVNSINQNIPVGYGIYFADNLLIQGKDQNSKLTFADIGDACDNMFSYDIVSGGVSSDVKLKIDIPYLHFENNVSNFDKASFGTGSRGDYDYPNLFNISSSNIEINGVKDGIFTTSNVGIEYLSNLSITNSELSFNPVNFICKEDNTPINFIVANSEAEATYTKNSTCKFNGSTLTFDGMPLQGTNLLTRAVVAANFIDISKGNFVVSESTIHATNANFMVGPAKFENCPEIILDNSMSAAILPNILSVGGTLSFINSNYQLSSKHNNIEFMDLGGPDFKLYFDQDIEHSGSFNAGGGCCFSAESMNVDKSVNTDIQANTMLDGAVDVPYNNEDRDNYRYISVNFLPPLPNIVEFPIDYPSITDDGHLPYYYDEVNDAYYEDPYGQTPIADLALWLNTTGRIPSLKVENKTCDLVVYTTSSKELIIDLTIKTPVEENNYLFESNDTSRFIGVMLNDKPLIMKVDYSLVEGDTPIIKLSDAILNNLNKGVNKIYIISKDGYGYKEFTILKDFKPVNPSKPSYDVPKTGIY